VCANHVDLVAPSARQQPCVWTQLACSDCGRMSSFLPRIKGRPIYSETERHEALGKRRPRDVSEPTPMDIDSEEGRQSTSSMCNGGSLSTSWPILRPNIDAFNAKDVIARSSPNTSPIYFYHRDKPFYECAYTSSYVCSSYLCLCPGLLISLRTRWSMTERYMPPPNTVRGEITPDIRQ
jgi:hypothetical protein